MKKPRSFCGAFLRQGKAAEKAARKNAAVQISACIRSRIVPLQSVLKQEMKKGRAVLALPFRNLFGLIDFLLQQLIIAVGVYREGYGAVLFPGGENHGVGKLKAVDAVTAVPFVFGAIKDGVHKVLGDVRMGETFGASDNPPFFL